MDAGSDEEARDAVIGLDNHLNLFFVVHVVLEEHQIRTISARIASRAE